MIDELATFDAARDLVGVIHRDSVHGLKGMDGVSVLELIKRQVGLLGGVGG